MQHFPALLSRVDSDAMADRCQALIEEPRLGILGRRAESQRRIHRLRRSAYAVGNLAVLAVCGNRLAPGG